MFVFIISTQFITQQTFSTIITTYQGIDSFQSVCVSMHRYFRIIFLNFKCLWLYWNGNGNVGIFFLWKISWKLLVTNEIFRKRPSKYSNNVFCFICAYMHAWRLLIYCTLFLLVSLFLGLYPKLCRKNLIISLFCNFIRAI